MVVPTGLAPNLSALVRTGLRIVSITGPVRLPSETCAEEDACLLPPSSGGGNSLKVQAVTCKSNSFFCSQVAQEGWRGPEEVKLIFKVDEDVVP